MQRWWRRTSTSSDRQKKQGTARGVQAPRAEYRRRSNMKPIWAELKPLLFSMALFSFVINLLYLVPALFMLQVFDRVIPTNSRETLWVLLGGVGTALFILFVL